MIEERQVNGFVVDHGVGRERHVADALSAPDERLGVVPCACEQVLVLHGRRVGHHAIPVEHGAGLVSVEPPRNVEDG